MPERKHPFYVGARVNAREQAKVDFATKLRGFSSRSEYVRDVVLRAAEDEARAAVGQRDKVPPARPDLADDRAHQPTHSNGKRSDGD